MTKIGNYKWKYKKQEFYLDQKIPIHIYFNEKTIETEDMNSMVIRDFTIVSALSSYNLIDASNSRHLEYFMDLYNKKIKKLYDINYSIYSKLDVIDISQIDFINITNRKVLNKQKIFEFTKKKNAYKKCESGLSYETLKMPNKKLLPTKYYYIAIPDCDYNLSQDSDKISLSIEPDSDSNWNLVRKLLFIKFNKPSLKEYLKREMINNLIK